MREWVTSGVTAPDIGRELETLSGKLLSGRSVFVVYTSFGMPTAIYTYLI